MLVSSCCCFYKYGIASGLLVVGEGGAFFHGWLVFVAVGTIFFMFLRPGARVVSFGVASRCRPANSRPRTVQRLARNVRRKRPTRILLNMANSNGAFAMTGIVTGINGPALVLDRGGALTTRLCRRVGNFFPGGTIRCCISCCSCCRPRTCLPAASACVRGSLTVGSRVSGLHLNTISTLLSNEGSIVIMSSMSYVCNVNKPMTVRRGVVGVRQKRRLSQGRFLEGLMSTLCMEGSVRLRHNGFHMGKRAMSVFVTCDSGILQMA